MKSYQRKILSVFSSVLLTVAFAVGCGTPSGGGTDAPPVDKPPEALPLTAEYGIADQSNLYGMCYLLEERVYGGSPFSTDDIPTEVRLLQNLGVKTVRHWIHCTTYMRDKDTVNESACQTMHAVLQECQKAGIVNIGMNHHNFNGGTSSVGKLKRNMTKGSEYVQWLNDYYTTWYNLVSEFPEVTYWEIDNELNNPDFMYNASDESAFTSSEMAAIATDMLWYASQGIHDANPEAITVMGGLTERMGLGLGDVENGVPDNAWFLQAIYDNIASGEYGRFYAEQGEEASSLDPDDYFEVVCWHPYVWSRNVLNEEEFIEKNNAIYEVVLKNERKHKKVFLTEVGFTDFTRGEETVAQSVANLYRAVASMPYVETVNIFKLYDVATLTWGGVASVDGGYSRYGLFYDPDPARVYYKIDGGNPTKTTDELCVSGAPKLSAYAFQKAAGGVGDLTLMANYYAEKE